MAAEEYDDEDYNDEETDSGSSPTDTTADRERARRQLSRGRIAQLGDRIAGGASRPGEQKASKSPFVLMLVGGVLAVGLLSAIFYYIIGREGESRRLAQAMTAFEQRKYAESEQLFLKFLEIYPKTASSDKARLYLHKSRVEKFIMTTTPDVKQGMQELEDLMRIGKDLNGYEEERDALRRYADRLTFAGARVGEILQQQEPLDISLKAMEILRRFSGEEGVPKDREEELIRRQRIAEAAIVKRLAFDEAVSQVRGFLEAGKTIEAISAREALLNRYEVLKDDKDVSNLLTEILNREQELIVQSNTGIDASTAEDPAALPSLSLTQRTKATNDQVSQGRKVFAVGIDSILALDSETGEPLWKRVIGENTAFAPVTIKGTEDAILVHSARTSEILLLGQNDGKLIWRQRVEGQPSGQPLLHEQQIYLTTDQGKLWRISASNGRISSSLAFTQPVIGPPTITRDGQSLLIPGHQMLVYTLNLSTLACTAVSYIDYQPGSVRTPMITAGDVYVLCDNNTSSRCRVRVLSLDSGSGRLSVRSTESVDGTVNDPCLLRGRELFIPSSPQRVTAFRITDDPDQTPLSRIGANQLEGGEQTAMHLLAGPGGQLWLAGRDLRKFQAKTNAVLLDSGVTAEGIHLQPIQFVDEGVFLTSREETLSSIYFTRVDREQMKGIWRTVVGSHLVAIGEAVGNRSILAISDYGQVYRVSADDISKGGFVLEAVGEGFRLPDKLASSVGGTQLLDGRLLSYVGAAEPAAWTFSPTGQMERKWILPDAPQVAPVAIAAGAVFGLPGRLHLTATTSGAAAEDYRASQAGSQQSSWKSLTALSDTQVLAVSADNQLIRVEYRSSPRPQLAEISVTRFEQGIEVAPAAANGLLFIATSDGKLFLMQASTLEVLAETELGGVPSQSPLIAGNRVFVMLGNQQLKVFSIDNGLQPVGSTDLAGQQVVGRPLVLNSGEFLLATSDGSVMRLNPDGIPTDNKVNVGQRLTRGPLFLNGQYLVVAVDGSLYALPSQLVQ